MRPRATTGQWRLFGLLAAAVVTGPPTAAASEGVASYLGAEKCATCHVEAHRSWKSARHSKMVQAATVSAVKGDFAAGKVKLRGETYRLGRDGETFFISEAYFSEKEREHPVHYTLGNRRIQHYLTTLEDGRIVVLPPTWDVTRREWFHNLEIVNRDEAGVGVQVWNKNCFGCHVSQQEKNYAAEADRYTTRWLDFGTNCERCHGPGDRHVTRYTEPERFPEDRKSYIVRLADLDAEKSTTVCAQCHSLRHTRGAHFAAGSDYYDYFMPLLEYSQDENQDPSYWSDGRTRRFSNDAFGFWQSECFLKGKATCLTCHWEAHEPDIERNPQLAPTNNALCTGCHTVIGERLAEHTHHAPSSRGSSCVECHMPATVVSIRASIRDHAMSLPAPENTVRHQIPNACNACHADRTPAWAVAALDRWYPEAKRSKWVRRADAYRAARAGKPEAIPGLIELARDPGEPPLLRANALGHLGRFPDTEAARALVEAASAEHPALRAIAALKLGEQSGEGATPALVQALADPRRVVRMSAAYSLLNLRVARLEGEPGRRFETAKQEYVANAAFNADDPSAQLEMGQFHLLNGDWVRAEKALEQARRLDHRQPGLSYFDALARLGQGRVGEARKLLERIESRDTYFEAARTLLDRLPR